MQDVSGFGSVINIAASNTFPLGVQIANFAGDTDPFDAESVEISGNQMGLNGDLIVWAQAKALPFRIAVIPGSVADQNLQILADANRVGPGKPSAGDVIQLAVQYPDGTATQYYNGRLLTAPFGKSAAGSGQLKTRVYGFVFESKSGA